MQIVKIFQNEICASVSRNTCYETKYNAPDALVMKGYHLFAKLLNVQILKLVIDALNEGMFKMTRMMIDKETSIPEISQINLNDFIATAYLKDKEDCRQGFLA